MIIPLTKCMALEASIKCTISMIVLAKSLVNDIIVLVLNFTLDLCSNYDIILDIMHNCTMV